MKISEIFKAKKLRSFFTSEKSIEFKIVLSCLIIIISLALFVSYFTIKNFKDYVDNNANSKSNEISKQIVYNYDNYFQGIIDTLNVVIEELDNTDVNSDPKSVEDYFFDVISYRKDITNITLFAVNGEYLVKTGEEIYSSDVIATMSWFYEALLQPSICYFSPPFSYSENDNRIFVTKYVNYNYNEDAGVLLFELNSDKILDIANNTNLGNGGQIVIMTTINDKFSVIFSSEEHIDSDILRVLNKKILGNGSLTIKSNKMSYNIETINNTRWRIGIFINIDESAAAQNSFAITLISICFVAIIITTILISVISKNIANPLKKLEAAMKEIEEADYLLVEEVNIGKQKEIASLSESFNLMMRRIKELMDKVVEEQETQRKSELKALQYQINPHFLYNTLDSIVWLVDNNKNKEASEMVVALAKLFRISISRGRNIITVKDELEHARSYLLIQSIRYADAFKYEFDIDPEVVEYTTLKLILQPMIENAIYHGLKNRIDEGYIKISAKLVNTKVVFEISDNGYGMRKEKIEELYENFKNPDLNDGVGLKNIYLRLKIYYGDEADLLIESELDEGTTIKIIIPMKTNM